jgi:hypothetical protein
MNLSDFREFSCASAESNSKKQKFSLNENLAGFYPFHNIHKAQLNYCIVKKKDHFGHLQ